MENINRKDFDQIKSFAAPPEKVVLAMKPIYHMISKTIPAKGKPVEWAAIRAFMQNISIKQILDSKADDIPEKVKAYVLSEFINTPEFDIDIITRASSAAGALASWAKSQLSYADILTTVTPMRN